VSSKGPPPQIRYGRGRTPWEAMVSLANLLYRERDERFSSAKADGQLEGRVVCVDGIDPNGGWVAELRWIPKW
jgi:hypothetical protein